MARRARRCPASASAARSVGMQSSGTSASSAGARALERLAHQALVGAARRRAAPLQGSVVARDGHRRLNAIGSRRAGGGRRHAAAQARDPPAVRARAPARGRRDRRADERDPVVERQLAGDQPGEPAVTGASTSGAARARAASSGTDSSASTAWPMRAGISAAGTPSASSSPARRLRLCGASAVRDEVAGAGEADHRLGPCALRLGEAPDLGEDVPGRGAGGVEALALGRAGGQRRGVLRRAGQLDADRVVGQLADDARAR